MNEPVAVPPDWRRTYIGAVTDERKERVGSYTDPPIVLSSTKHHGLVPSDEYFRNRIVYSANLWHYKVVSKNWFAYATNHLAEGSIGLQCSFAYACVSPIYTVFSCRESIDPDYLYRVLKSPGLISQYKIHEQASVDRRGAVRYRDFAQISIILPPLAEQRRIAEILDTADETIRSSEQLIAKLEKTKQGLIYDLLTPRADWKTKRLGDYLLSIDAGRSPDLPDRPAGSDEWGVLKVSAIRPHGLQEDENKVVVRASLIDSKIEVRNGDLLMSRANTTALVGLACYARDPRPGLMLSDKTLRLNLAPHTAVPEFAAYLLQTPLARHQIETNGTGSSGSMKNISQEEIRSLVLPLPNLQEQHRILAAVESARVRLDILRGELFKFRLLKRGLMDDLLTGRVRVGASA